MRPLAHQRHARQHVEARLTGAPYPAPVADDPAMPSPRPALRVLGVPALVGPDGEPITFRTRKHFALLIYLALEPQVHRREKLGALLWPGASTSEARHSLATGLSVLRAKLGRERIETTRDTARLVPGTLELDLDRLARGEIHATDDQPALAVAPLLQEFVVADAEPWDQWRDGLVAKWTPAIRDALLARIDRSRRQGNTRAMEVLADALLTLDDLSEDGVRAKMESRAFAGDRLTALQVYEDWRVRLADELGAQPSDLVAGMALRLRRRGWERTSGEHIPAVRTDQWKDRPFVGRAKEYETLYEGWEGCQRGTPWHVLLTGESGVGKSTLMERLTTAAGLQGAVATRIQCHEVEKEIPFGAIGGLITALLEQPGATSVAPECLSELSRTVSAVRRRFPSVAVPPEATGEMVRIRLADAFHDLVRTIAEEHPLILVMDDIHLGDDASVCVMHLLLRRLTDERVLVLCTLRQGEGQLAPSARGMMERAELARMKLLPLPPLTEAESSELLGHLLPGDTAPPPSTVRRALLRAAGGLPMLLELLVRDWLGHGDRCVALAVEAMTEEPGAAGGAGETYRRLLERLTLGLDSTARSVLNLAAILGSQLNAFELYSLVDLTLPQAMAGLSHLATLRILRDGGRGLEFVNEVMRGEVYFAVPSSVRRVLHSKVADRLIERQASGEEMLGLAIAWHCIRSGRGQEAGDWLIRGGTEAIARSALAEAEEALESGYRNLPAAFSGECGCLLAEVLLDQGRYAEAHAHAKALVDLGVIRDSSGFATLLQLTGLALDITKPSRQDGVLSALLTIAGTNPQPAHRLRAFTLATALVACTLEEQHVVSTLQVLSATLEDAPQEHVNRYRLMQAQLYYNLRRVDEAEDILTSLSAVPTKHGPALYQYHLISGAGNCKVARGDYTSAASLLTRAMEVAIRAGATLKERTAASNLAVVFFRLGRLGDALHMGRHALGLGALTQAHSMEMGCLGALLCCLALTGTAAEFNAALVEIQRFVASDVNLQLMIGLRLWIADALFLRGHVDDARHIAREGLADHMPIPLPYLGSAARWATQLYVRDRNPKWLTPLRDALSSIERADMLDQFEIAVAASVAMEMTPAARLELSRLIQRAATQLPPTAIGMVGRLGLPHRIAEVLTEDPHPPARAALRSL